MTKRKAKFISTLIIVLLPLAIILSNVSFFATNYNFFLRIYRDKNIYNRFPNSEIIEGETRNLLGYYRNKNLLDQNFYSEQAIRHLKNVKNLLKAVKFTNFVLLALIFLLSTALYYNKEKENLIRAYLKGSLVSLNLVVGIATLLLLDFQKSFFAFHLIFFRDNDWLFASTDNLVKMFPQEFFVSFAFYLAANIIAIALLIIIFALIIKRINAKPII